MTMELSSEGSGPARETTNQSFVAISEMRPFSVHAIMHVVRPYVERALPLDGVFGPHIIRHLQGTNPGVDELASLHTFICAEQEFVIAREEGKNPVYLEIGGNAYGLRFVRLSLQAIRQHIEDRLDSVRDCEDPGSLGPIH